MWKTHGETWLRTFTYLRIMISLSSTVDCHYLLFSFILGKLGTSTRSFLLSIQFSPSWWTHCQETFCLLSDFSVENKKNGENESRLCEKNNLAYSLLDDKQDMKRTNVSFHGKQWIFLGNFWKEVYVTIRRF